MCHCEPHISKSGGAPQGATKFATTPPIPHPLSLLPLVDLLEHVEGDIRPRPLLPLLPAVPQVAVDVVEVHFVREVHCRATQVAVLRCAAAHNAAGGVTLPVVRHFSLEDWILATEYGRTNVGVSESVCCQKIPSAEENKYGRNDGEVVHTYQILVATCG